MKIKKKVALIVTTVGRTGGGVSQVVADIQKLLSTTSDFEVHIVGGDDSSCECGEFIHSLPIYRMFGIGYIPTLIDEIERIKPDVIHLHGLWLYSSFATLQLRRNGYPVIISPHGMLDSWALSRAKIKKMIVSYLFENENIRMATLIHALNDPEKTAVHQLFPGKKVKVIPNAVDEQRCPRPIFCDTVKKVIYLSRIHPKKGVSNLVDAWIRLPDSFTSRVSLEIYGWGESVHIRELQCQIANARLPSLKYLGPVYDEDKRNTYENADLFVLPSYSEGLPVAVLEAWSFGVPALITEACNLNIGIERGAAILCTPDVGGLVNALIYCLSLNSKQLNSMRINALSVIKDSFSFEIARKMYCDMYSSVIDKTNF